MIVADTSTIVHLFNQTQANPVAQQVWEKDPHWIFPPLWQDEYANVMAKMASQDNKRINTVISHFLEVISSLEKYERRVDRAEALEVALRQKISAYDAQFVVLAMQEETWLVTEDKEIVRKCPEWALSMGDFLKVES